MRDRRYVMLGLLLGALTLTCCAHPVAPVATSAIGSAPDATSTIGLISNGMSEAEVVQRLGSPDLVFEQPRTLGQVQTPNGVEFREKRHYTYYYPGPSQSMDLLIMFEDGVVVDWRQGAR